MIFVPFVAKLKFAAQHYAFNPSRADCGPAPRIFYAIAPVCLHFLGLDRAAACSSSLLLFWSRSHDFAAMAMFFRRFGFF